MYINKHGKTYKDVEKISEQFECEYCGCEFTARKVDEIYEDFNAATSNISVSLGPEREEKDYLVCSCPECHRIVKKIRTRKVPNYVFTPSITLTESEGVSNRQPV